jgi:hypothetical protein
MEGTNDPIYLTYYMMDWKNSARVPSEDKCVTCGESMLQVEPITNKRGVTYEGRVCHSCKCLFWIRKD